MKNRFYITSAIAYTNAGPHLGHLLEFVQTDVLARYHRLIGDDVMFVTGTDEHGTKITRAAAAAGKPTHEFVDEIAKLFIHLNKKAGISNDDFIRTTDQKRHWPAAIKLWELMAARGDLYKKKYEGLYCVGHEAFIKKSELVDGRCPIHKTEPEKLSEENWFFKITKYKNQIYKLIESDDLKIVPESRKNEILNLITDAEDVSFSRPRSVLEWGIPVPSDNSQVMYVWCDALSSYLSAIGYASESEQFKTFWPADVHLIGKDILRFHALYWPAMLLSAGLPLSRSVVVHGFITVDGEKMSKSIGNVIDPFVIIEKYGADVVRYFLLREIPSDGDGDFSEKKLIDRYNGDLANGLGNLVQRVATLIDTNLDSELIYNASLPEKDLIKTVEDCHKKYQDSIEHFKLHDALSTIWELVGVADKYINDKRPWAEVKVNPAEFLKTMTNATFLIYRIVDMLEPFMPSSVAKIRETFGAESMITKIDGYKFRIKKGTGLFPRLK